MMSRLSRTGLGVALAVFAVAPAARGQVIRGKVQDVVTHAPIPHVSVALWNGADSAIRSVITNDSGQFLFRAPGAGKYSVDLRHISYTRVTTTPVLVALEDTISLTVEMTSGGVLLDTIVSKAAETRGVFTMTSGQEYVRQHFIDGKGLIISGFLIERSGMTMSEYLGKMPGLHLTGANMGASTPVVPAGKGEFLVADSGSGCLYARIDRYSLLYMMMQDHSESIDDVVKIKDVMAVEVYHTHRDVPKEWGADAIATELYSRRNQGTTYVIGHTGFPAIDQKGSSDPSSSGAMTPLALDAMDYGTAALNPDNFRPPPCGFLQIWTGAAWGNRGHPGGGGGN